MSEKCPLCQKDLLPNGDGSKVLVCPTVGCIYAVKTMWWGKW